MFNALFRSNVQVKILNYFLLPAEKKTNLRQLIADLNLPANSIRRELKNLIKGGLIIEEKIRENSGQKELKRERKYFSANKNFILYPEIRALFIKAQILSSQKFLDHLQKICQPKFLALTGLFTNYPEAQTDILIVGKVRRRAFLKLIKKLEKDLGREINFTIMGEREFRYRRTIMDIFLYNVLEGKTIVLVDNLGLGLKYQTEDKIYFKNRVKHHYP